MAAFTQVPAENERTSLARPLTIVIAAHVAFAAVMGGVLPAALSGVVSALNALAG